MASLRGRIARGMREPLIHFILIGAALFALAEWRGADAGDDIVVTPGQVDVLVSTFARTWNRAPTEVELTALLDETVREELAAREATRAGLDRDDPIIRRRLRQKLEFLVEDATALAPPTDAQLQAWLERDPGRYAPEPRLALRQVHLDSRRRGEAAAQEAAALVARLQAAGPQADISGLGDARLLPQELAAAPRSEVARVFGEQFTEAALKAPPGRWTGPLPSTYGLHVVLVQDRAAADRPALADVRLQVERDFLADRRKAQLDAMYAKLLERHRVVVQKR